MKTLKQIDARIAKLQRLKKKKPDHDLLYAVQQAALNEIAWVLYGKVPEE